MIDALREHVVGETLVRVRLTGMFGLAWAVHAAVEQPIEGLRRRVRHARDAA